MKNYDFSGWATRNNLQCSDNRIIMKDAFKHNDGKQVPLVWMHQHNDPDNVLGHAVLQNMDEGVYAYCSFNDSESGAQAKELVKHGDVNQLSIYANQLKQQGNNVMHGNIREVSLVLAGANPGAFIDSIICHGEESDEEAIIFTGEDITLAHGEDESIEEEETLEHADKKDESEEEEKSESKEEEKSETKEESEIKHQNTESEKEDKPAMAEEKKTEVQPEAETKEKTVKDVFDTLTEEQKTVVYALIGQALEDAGVSDDEDVKHSDEIEGGNETMYHNVFENENVQEMNVLSHADQETILKNAKSVGSFKTALSHFVEDNSDTLSHGMTETTLDQLFPDFKDLNNVPELVERDHTWVSSVMQKAHKSPAARIRTRHANATADGIRAKGYVRDKNEGKKALSAAIAAIVRTTEPQTVYYRDDLHRDDVLDMDFDVISYQKTIMKNGLEEEVALAALIGDGRDTTAADKISPEKIRPVWGDNEVYTIQALVNPAAAIQGTDSAANFGANFLFTENVIEAVLAARVNYKGAGVPDFYCAPSTLNKMLMTRDLNGRRIYESAADVAKALNVGAVHTVNQMENKTRTDDDDNEFKLHGLIVNMANYTFGCAKGGEITTFEDFDIDFNNYKYLMETRLSGALAHPYSAIAVEEAVVAG